MDEENKRQLSELLQNYDQLARYCDAIFQSIINKYPQKMLCKKGCFKCCTIESISQVEAHVIRLQMAEETVAFQNDDMFFCPFLVNGTCSIYKARPIICRTHGLLLYDKERKTIEQSCDLNFTDTDLSTFKPELALDNLTITENLMRLNLAYALINKKDFNTIPRIAMQDLIAGN